MLAFFDLTPAGSTAAVPPPTTPARLRTSPFTSITARLIGAGGASARLTPSSDAVSSLRALSDILEMAQRDAPFPIRPLSQHQLMRRIQRRMRIGGHADLASYAAALAADRAEIAALRRSLHLRASSFFTDPEHLYHLERYAMLALFAAGAMRDGIRILVTGSGSGEEAYSVAMLFSDYARGVQTPPPIEIHALENDETLCAAAREGTYPPYIELDLAPACLRRYFKETPDGYSMTDAVRSHVTFHQGMGASDVALSELDLIVCRNPVLLMDPVRQDELMRSCHARLRPGGYLLLGSPFTSPHAGVFFEPVMAASGLYRSNETPSTVPAPLTEAMLSDTDQRDRTQGVLTYARHLKEAVFHSEERLRMVSEYAPASGTGSATPDILNDLRRLKLRCARLENLVTHSGAGLLELDSDLRIRVFSDSLRPLLGLMPADIGRPLSDFQWPFRQTVDDLAAGVLRTETPSEATIRQDGRTYTVRLNPIVDDSGVMTGMAASFVDITAFTRVGEWAELRQDALRQLPDPVIVTNRSLDILYVNAAAAERYGVDAALIAGRNLDRMMWIDWPNPQERERAYAALASEGAWIGRQLHHAANGRVHEVETAVSMLCRDDGEEVGMLIVVRDIARRDAVGTEALRRMIADLQGPSEFEPARTALPSLFAEPGLRPSRPPRERIVTP